MRVVFSKTLFTMHLARSLGWLYSPYYSRAAESRRFRDRAGQSGRGRRSGYFGAAFRVDMGANGCGVRISLRVRRRVVFLVCSSVPYAEAHTLSFPLRRMGLQRSLLPLETPNYIQLERCVSQGRM